MKLIKSFWLTFKISAVLTLVFIMIFKQYSFEGIAKVFLISVMYSFILGFGQGLINDFLSKKYDWVIETNKRVWFGIISTVLYTIPAVLVVNYVLFVEIQGLDRSLFFKNQYFWIHLFYILISFLISSFLHARSFMLEWKKATKKESEQHQIIAKTETAKFETLKNQIDPHFLFNSLNVLTSLIGENPNQAEKFTTKLSKVYRYVLEQRNKILVPVEEELNFSKTYIDLLQMRFEDAIVFEFPKEISSELKIVPLSLQLLLENAVKHNVVSDSKPLRIKIYQENGYLKIENNINLKRILDKKSTKVGLQNITSRYGLITDKNVSVTKNNEKFVVELPLLKSEEKMENTIENTKYNSALQKVENLRGFYMNLSSYVFVMLLLIFINLYFQPNYLWFWYPLLGWGIGLLLHFISIHEFKFSWEKRKLDQLVNEKRMNVVRAKNRIKELKGFYGHLGSFVLVSLILLAPVLFDYFNRETLAQKSINQFFSKGIMLLMWGVMLLFHTLKVFVYSTSLLGKEWEEKKIKEFLNKN